MRRRGFLSLLGLGGLGLALPSVAKGLPALARPPAPVRKAKGKVTPAWFMHEVSRYFSEALGSYRTTYVPRRATRGARNLYVMTDSKAWDGSQGIDTAQLYARLCGEALAVRVKREQLRGLYKLDAASGGALSTVVTSPSRGLCLRGVEAYNIVTDETSLRIDLMGRA